MFYAHACVIERLRVRGYRQHVRLHGGRALCNLGVNLALREDGELMQHRQATMPVEGRRVGRRSIARTLPGLSVGWLASRPGCIRPPSLCKPGDPLSPSHPRILSLIRSGFGLAPILTRERRDGPFTIDTIVVASWPSPLRRRSLVSSTDSICPPRGCLITGRRVDRGRARQKGRSSVGRG